MRGYCDICGQRLTDASGHWTLIGRDRGFFAVPGLANDQHIECCLWCKDSIDEAIAAISEQHRKEMEKLER